MVEAHTVQCNCAPGTCISFDMSRVTKAVDSVRMAVGCLVSTLFSDPSDTLAWHHIVHDTAVA